MLLTDKIKELVAEGKTSKAIDLLQDFLKGRDNSLLNQSLLLENQYNDLSRKLQQGLLDSSSELNRVNLALLNLVDEAQKLDPNADFEAENRPYTEGGKNDDSVNKGLIIFGILAVLGIAGIIGLIFFIGKSDKKEPVKTEQTPSSSDNSTKNSTENASNNGNSDVLEKATDESTKWRFEPSRLLTIPDGNNYGRQRLSVNSVLVRQLDINRKQISLVINTVCEQTSNGSCMTNFLNFTLRTADGKLYKSLSEYPTTNPTEINRTQKITVDFDVPTGFKGGEFSAFYTDQPEKKAVVKILKTSDNQ